MIDRRQRTVILELHRQEHGIRKIARLVKVSRNTVRQVVRISSEAAPTLDRSSQLEPRRAEIEKLFERCQGNRVRVLEELEQDDVEISYPALTAFCRNNGIGLVEKPASGIYHFRPGQEMQHDTSPHRVVIAGKSRKIQTASTVLAFSRVVFAQMFPRFRRFECKTHLTASLRYFGGTPSRAVIDNTSVVVAAGAGPTMTPAPEMVAFGDRFGFHFVAHAIGHSDRKGRVESQIGYIEKNFLAGRTFESWSDLDQQLLEWCNRVNGKFKRTIRAIPNDLLAQERPKLQALPEWIPEPCLVSQRTVDSQAYVHLDGNRYSVPEGWVDRRVQVRETRHRIEIDLDPYKSVEHVKEIDRTGRRITSPEHRTIRRRPSTVSADEAEIRRRLPEIADYAAALRARSRWNRVLRRLLALVGEYPREAVIAAVTEAHHYSLFDLDRLETMILRRIRADYFRLDGDNQ